jgi:hypothetical protein
VARLRFGLILGTTLALLPAIATAQDAQYWTNDYGNRARLLGGAMVGSASDLSAVYYNPGRLALLESPEAFLSGFVFSHDHLSLSNPIGPGEGITSSRFNAAAALIAGELRFDWLGDSHLAYSYMSRHSFDVRLKDETILERPQRPDLPDLDLLAGTVSYETRLSEHWAGLTWARSLGAEFGIGISTFVAVRSQRARRSLDVRALSDEGLAIVVGDLRDYEYYAWRVLPKIGLGWERERLSLGLSVTAPGLRLFGSGDETFNVTLVGQEPLPGGSLPTAIAADYQEDLSAHYNSPWSVAGGAAYEFSQATRAHASAEWFASNRRTILAAEPFVPQTGGEAIDPSVSLGMKSVFNVGLGVEHVFSDRLTSYGSFRTDFSGAEAPLPTETTFAIWDLYHIGAGVQATVNRSNFTAGLVYSHGSATRPSGLIDFDPESDSGILARDTKYSFSRFTLLLGFQLAFAPKLGIG